MFVADDVDLRGPCDLRALVDLEDDVDAILLELDHLRIDGRGEAALAAIELDDAGDVGTGLGAGEDLPRRELDLRHDLVFLDPLVALEDDPVDHRIFADLDDEVASVGAGDLDVGEQFGRVEILDRLVELLAVVGLADAQLGVGEHRLRLQALVAGDVDRMDRAGAGQRRWSRGFGGGSGGRRRDGRRSRRGLRGRLIWASAGTARPPRIVPTKRAAHSRRPLVNELFAVTRPRPNYLPARWPEGVPVRTCPARSYSTDQPASFDHRPKDARSLIVTKSSAPAGRRGPS